MGFRFIATDCRGENVEWNGLSAAVQVTLVSFGSFAVAVIVSCVAIIPAWAAIPVETLVAIATLRTVFSSRLFSGLDQFFLAFVAFELIVALAALLVLIFEPRAVLAEHTEIMIRELQIIFGLDAVSRELCVARHALVLLEQLRRVAPLAIVLPVARLSAEVRPPLSTTAAPAAALSIIDQMPTSLRSVF